MIGRIHARVYVERRQSSHSRKQERVDRDESASPASAGDEQLTDNVFRSMPIVLRGVNQVGGGTDNEMPRIYIYIYTHACDSLIGGRGLVNVCFCSLWSIGDSGYCVAINTGWCKSK